jgi:hypothetical protein
VKSVASQLPQREAEVFMNLIPYIMLWCLLALVVLSLALFRKLTSMREDALIHIGPGEERLIPKQVEMTNKLHTIDAWGKTLTVIVIAGGLLLAGIYLYKAL